MGIINAGTAVGAVVAPPLIALHAGGSELALGLFSITGAIGLLWTVWWRHVVFPARNSIRG